MPKESAMKLPTSLWKKVQKAAKIKQVSGAAMLRIIVDDWLKENEGLKK